ncbi:MAG TPA: Gfo/Idh/MocA family oxidoreductase [Chloroflexota bacterium]|nr:Gfo/Idh/MocA family oxidoreductase [Chloroflexota bacterium]
MTTPLTVAVIGLRSVGMAHVRAWAARQRSHQDVCLTALSDLDLDLCRRAQTEHGAERVFGDYRDLLARDPSEASLVTVCLPTALHERVVVECLRQGRHVLCEKPPALDAAAAQRMADAAREANRVLAYGFQRRFHPQVRAALEVVQSGRTGPLYYGRCGWVRSEPAVAATTPWKLSRASAGGGLFNIGIHLLDVAWYLMGRPRPVSVCAYGSTHGTRLVAEAAGLPLPPDPAYDTTAALVRFEHADGAPAALLVESSLALHRLPSATPGGSTASTPQSIYCDLSGTDGGLSVYPPVFVAGRHTETLTAEDDSRELTTRQLLIEDFLTAVRTNTAPVCPPEDGVTIQRIVDAIETSATLSREVTI